jgi:hypothetical protein
MNFLSLRSSDEYMTKFVGRFLTAGSFRMKTKTTASLPLIESLCLFAHAS